MPREDAKIAFDRERRRRMLAKLSARLRFEPDDVSHMLPFDEVVAASAPRGVDIGEQVITLDSIVGTVDRRRGEFDRDFRPSPDPRALGAHRRGPQARRGDAADRRLPHRRPALRPRRPPPRLRRPRQKEKDINARVTDVRTKLGADRALTMRDLPLKAHERVFHERVPLSAEQRSRIELSDEWRYAQLANLVEAWAYRASLSRGQLLSRRDAAHLWFTEEYEPILDVLREAGLGGGGTETERYLRIAMLRFLLLQTFDWSDDIAEKLSSEAESPSAASESDTMTHQIIKELRD